MFETLGEEDGEIFAKYLILLTQILIGTTSPLKMDHHRTIGFMANYLTQKMTLPKLYLKEVKP